MRNLTKIFITHSIVLLCLVLLTNFLLKTFYQKNYLNLEAISFGVILSLLFFASIILIGRSICFKDPYRVIYAFIGFNLKIIVLLILFFIVPDKSKIYILSLCIPFLATLSSFFQLQIRGFSLNNASS